MGSQAYTNTKTDTHGAPRAPPQVLCQLEVPHQLGVLQVQGASRPVIVAPATAARWIKVCHSVGTPTHCSRTLSSWMWAHIPSDTPCRTSSNHRRRSSIPPPASTYGSCMLVQHQRHLVSHLSGLPSAHVLVQHQHHLSCLCPTHGSMDGRTGPWRADSPTISASWPRGPTSANTNTKGRVNIHIYIIICYTIKITKHKYTNIPL
jgi:hypothetical protein